MLHVKFGFGWPSDFRTEEFEYYGNIHVYCPEKGLDEPMGSVYFSESLIFSPTAHFHHDFSFKWHFNSFPHSNA